MPDPAMSRKEQQPLNDPRLADVPKVVGQQVDPGAAAQPSARDGSHQWSRLPAAQLHEVERFDQNALRARGRTPQIALELVSGMAKICKMKFAGPLAVQPRVGAAAVAMSP